MTSAPTQGAEAFACQQSIFGAYDQETNELVFVVESTSEVEALSRVDSVSSLLGYKGVWELVVNELDALPTGVPSFLKAFFEVGSTDIVSFRIASGTDTLQ